MGKRSFGQLLKFGGAGRGIGVILAAALIGALPRAGHAQGACREDTLWLKGDWGQARFTVEVADTRSARAEGLMHRSAMPASAGMIFVYDRTGPVSFWMRNTLIPLDMLFADEHGVIQRIHHEAIPLDETPIPGGEAIRYVLEINGGMAKSLGITEGSAMRHPSFLQEIANWPC
ncbi:DUF192 domain-containing protein [Shimia marina]|uniref:ACR n=1 Tax=Shimia marina TaxID=321267 RepID=A0A0P1EUL4_9RHOB|nr:DUF192 domain-containing protein [Shimia marina]CUH54389.1 hypothetical protein SHM7688_03859 [Shimia marina]SFE02449.1 hypothetical protein SAMN04488037_104267 [Shimia marina]